MKFAYLRVTPWNPTFDWVKTSLECADRINIYHEDYPKYIGVTDSVLRNTTSAGKIFNRHLLLIHRTIFSDKLFAGKLREIGVVVGYHKPPKFELVSDLMEKLQDDYYIEGTEELIEWYKDFETIHPFQDGNGRVGGVVVASYAHSLYPEKGWLAPNQ